MYIRADVVVKGPTLWLVIHEQGPMFSKKTVEHCQFRCSATISLTNIHDRLVYLRGMDEARITSRNMGDHATAMEYAVWLRDSLIQLNEAMDEDF